MQHLITLYTPELLQAFSVLTALLFGANILQAIAAINKRNALTEAHDGKQAAMEMLKQTTDKAKKVQAERDMANELRDRCEKTMRAAIEENDKLMIKEKELTTTCDDLFDALCNAVEKMPVPFHLRKRDENGRFVKVSAFKVATALHGEMASANRKRAIDNAINALWDAKSRCDSSIKKLG
jgi:hypothetical protein